MKALCLLLVAVSIRAVAAGNGAWIEAYVPILEPGGVRVRKVPYWSKFNVPEASFEAIFTPLRVSPLGENPPWGNMNLASQAGLGSARVDLVPKEKCRITLDVMRLRPVKPIYFQKPFGRAEILQAVIESLRWNLGLAGADRCELVLSNLKQWPELDAKAFATELIASH